ncbi:MAG: cytochrome c maturation protein CcmE [Dehalococcoidia bacterium]|nr:MAG: cytochrome c maturation protein CcmE [Dehalococcoidia bacterium]
MKKRKFLIAGIVLFAAIGFLAVMAFRGAAMYSYTVSELLEKGDAVLGQTVKASGEVAPGSVSYEPDNILKFVITEGGNQLPVVYQGVVPDTFVESNEVTVEGQLDTSGIFQARTIMPKCASKYEPE